MTRWLEPIRPVMIALKFALLGSCVLATEPSAGAQAWKVLTSSVDTNLRGVSVAQIAGTTKRTVWASGSKGVLLRSIDDGQTWNQPRVPDAANLDFRGVVAFNDQTAYLMASGEGEKSRIYKTTDGGVTWVLQFKDSNPAVFLDSIACLDEQSCYALGDPVDGKFLLLRTSDGKTWNHVPADHLPSAMSKEGAFAASNSSLLVFSSENLVIVTGGFHARVLRTLDGGANWQATKAPISHENASSGIFAVTSVGANSFVVVGGDYGAPSIPLHIAATSSENGQLFSASLNQPSGYRSGIAKVQGKTLMAVGPTGTDISEDLGLHWKQLDALSLNAVTAAENEVFAVGPRGAVVQLERNHADPAKNIGNTEK